MALTLKPENQRKIATLSMRTGMSQAKIVNLLVAAVDEIGLEQMETEKARNELRPRRVSIRQLAHWRVAI